MRLIADDKGRIIIISMAKGWGGAEEYLENLRCHLMANGIRCQVLARKGGEYATRCIADEGVISIPHTIRGFLDYTGKDLRHRIPKVIHAHRYYDILRGWYLKRICPGSLFILYQQCYLNHPHYIPLLLPDAILCISGFVKSSITRRFPSFANRIDILRPGIDLTLFHTRKKDYRINGPARIGMVGRFDKNQADLLHIACELKKRGIAITLHLAGSGKEDEVRMLKELTTILGISNDVSFRGIIPHRSMPDFYQDMDLCVSSMKKEGLSLVAMEAMACGLPFVAYDAPGFDELIEHREDGILVKGGIQEFASAIQDLVQSEDMRKRIGEMAAEKAMRSFGMERCVKGYLSFLTRYWQKRGHARHRSGEIPWAFSDTPHSGNRSDGDDT